MNIKINLGSGLKRFDGFINVDHDARVKPDFVVDLEREPLPFLNDSVVEVKAHHILEHMGEGYFHLIKEIYRVCQDGALIDVVVPHHFHEVFLSDPTHRRPITVEGLRLFSKKYNQEHIEKWGSSSGLGLYYDVDFEVIDFGFTPDGMYEEVFKRSTPQEIMMMVRERNNVIIETWIKLIALK